MNIGRDRQTGEGQRGAVILIVAISLAVLIGIAALAIDIGFLLTTRSELQNVADASALAGARYLGDEYAKLSLSEIGGRQFTHGEVYAVVKAVAEQNKAANKSIVIRPEDVLIGLWDVEQSDEDIWHETLVSPDAVRVIARRDDKENSPISTFLAGALNIHTMNVSSRKAIAALSGPAYMLEGELKTPFGLSKNVFPYNCGEIITFSPTTESCAGWHNFFDPINANAMVNKLLGFIQGDNADCETCGGLLNGADWLTNNFGTSASPAETPLTSVEDEYRFQGGDIASLFNGSYLDSDYNGNTGTVLGNPQNKPAPIIALFDYFRYRDDDGDDSIWTAMIPVYEDSESCINPNTSIPIRGFAKIQVLNVIPPPNKLLEVRIDCELAIIESRSGGTTYGNLKGTIPNLVK